MEPISLVTSHLVPRFNYADGSTTPSTAGPSLWTCPNASFAIGTYMTLLDTRNLCPGGRNTRLMRSGTSSYNALSLWRHRSETTPPYFLRCARGGRCACDNMRWGDRVHLGGVQAWRWKPHAINCGFVSIA